MKLGIHVVQADCPIYGANGQQLSPELDQRAEAMFTSLMDGGAPERPPVKRLALMLMDGAWRTHSYLIGRRGDAARGA